MYWRRVVSFLVLFIGFAAGAAAQLPQSSNPLQTSELGSPFGKVVVRIQEVGGASISAPAWVRIYSDSSTFQRSSGRLDSYQITFETVPIGEYHVEVSAPGYVQAVADASVLTPNGSTHVWVELRPESGPNSAAAANSGPPVLAPKARKEMEAAGAALRANDLKKAQEHVDRAKKLAPGHPDVHYLQGLIYFQQQDIAAARKALETAVGIYAEHAKAQAALGVVLFRLGEFAAAVPVLEKAVELTPQDWQSHRALAMSHMQLRTYDKARARAERAIETAGERAPELHLLLARVLIALEQKEKASAELQAFLTAHPGHPATPEAQRLLASVLPEKKPERPAAEAGPDAAKVMEGRGDGVAPAVRVGAALPEVRSGPGRWAPPAVDDTPPVLLKNTSCALPEVLAGTGKRAVALVHNLQSITATEKVEQADLDNDGNQVQVRTSTFEYMVSITEPRPGYVDVEESRRALNQSAVSPRFMANGLGALALVFHPYYVKDFEMRCEGLTEVQGQPAWSVYFKQRAGLPSRIRSYTTQGGRSDVPLKGRAWIAANNYQVVKLETDLVAPIKKLKLEQEHLVIEYQPVEFKTRKVRLWLPARAQMYAHLGGRRYLHQHSFSGYLVFAVDVFQKPSEKQQP